MPKVASLPSSKSEFWAGADIGSVNTKDLPKPVAYINKVKKVGSHVIVPTSGGECAIALDWRKFTIKDGKIVKL